MYEEKPFILNWKGIIIKIAMLILVIILIVWLVPTPKLDSTTNKIFSDNLNSMKEAAKNYYVGDTLPSNKNDSTKLTLKEMLDRKIITDFVDKDNNICDYEKSYVMVTKQKDNEYELKVLLSCEKQTDQITETINTSKTDDSDNNKDDEKDDNKKNDDKKDSDDKKSQTSTITQYYLKKGTYKKVTDYICPEGYVISNGVCYREAKYITVDLTPLYTKSEIVQTESYKKADGSYACVTASDTLMGARCYRKIPMKFIGYDCPTDYNRENDICVKIIPGSTVAKTDVTKNVFDKYIYKWSPKKTENEWTYTGKSRVVEK